jgi:hypothetical protein
MFILNPRFDMKLLELNCIVAGGNAQIGIWSGLIVQGEPVELGPFAGGIGGIFAIEDGR